MRLKTKVPLTNNVEVKKYIKGFKIRCNFCDHLMVMPKIPKSFQCPNCKTNVALLRKYT